MAKFNTNPRVPDDKNLEDFPSYKREDSKKEIASIVLSSLLKGNSFYESEKDRVEKVFEFATQHPDLSEFLAKAMIYTRNTGNMRSISHVMAVSLLKNAKGTPYLRKAIGEIAIRPDDLTEILALYKDKVGLAIPNALRRAIKDSLEDKFDEYQLKKYFGGKRKVKVSDLVKLAHPKPKNDEQAEMFKRAIEGKLKKIETAQTVNAGLTGEERRDKYLKMIKDGKLGYMALLKNLVNMLKVDNHISKDDLETIVKAIKNKKAIKNSRVLPFRFLQAYESISEIPSLSVKKEEKLRKALEKAFKVSAKNVRLVPEGQKLAILLDESASMGGFEYKDPFSIGKVLMAGLLVNADKEDTFAYLWANSVRKVKLSKHPLKFASNLSSMGGGTDLSAPIYKMIEKGKYADVIVILTDMQQNSPFIPKNYKNAMSEYKKKINPNVKTVFWNLEGYGGAAPVKFNDQNLEIAGYSDKLLELIPKLLENKDALIDEIEKIDLNTGVNCEVTRIFKYLEYSYSRIVPFVSGFCCRCDEGRLCCCSNRNSFFFFGDFFIF